MKPLLKFIIIVFLNMISIFIFSIFLDHLAALIAGRIPSVLEITDWWYISCRDGKVLFLISTAILSSLLYLIYQITYSYIDTRTKFMIGIVVGCTTVFVVVMMYWNYVHTSCFGFEESSLEYTLAISYGDTLSQLFFWEVYSCTVFVIGIFVNKFEILIKNKVRRISLHQIYYYERLFFKLLYFWGPFFIVLSSSYLIVGIIGFNIKNIFLFFVGIIVSYSSVRRIRQLKSVNCYFEEVIRDHGKPEHVVIVQESKYAQKSFFSQFSYKKNLLERMKNKGIYFLPFEIGIIPDSFIKVDAYDEWMRFRTASEKMRIINEMMTIRGAFNLMYVPYCGLTSTIEYDGVFTGMEELSNAIIKLDGYLDYKKRVVYELNKIDMGRFKTFSCVKKEISVFRWNMENMTDEVLSFDYAVKWLEITNYLFALIGISKNTVPVSARIRELIKNADFKKWRRFINDELVKDSDLMTILTSDSNDVAFREFKKIWHIVTLRQYSFEKNTPQEMLDAANQLRDYTRGHGVYTFEVSQDINIALIKILVFLINCLIEYSNLNDSLNNLEVLGWLKYIGDIPYYLYSVDDYDYEYKSFQKGSDITLPLDIYG